LLEEERVWPEKTPKIVMAFFKKGASAAYGKKVGTKKITG